MLFEYAIFLLQWPVEAYAPSRWRLQALQRSHQGGAYSRISMQPDLQCLCQA